MILTLFLIKLFKIWHFPIIFRTNFLIFHLVTGEALEEEDFDEEEEEDEEGEEGEEEEDDPDFDPAKAKPGQQECKQQ